MNYMISFILLFSIPVWAEQKEYERSLASLNFEQWSEPLYLKSPGTQDQDTANFRGFSMSVSHLISYPKWGWSYGLGYAQGKANGGGNSIGLSYQQGQQNWSRYHLESVFFYKVVPRVGMGTQIIVSYKKISWPEDKVSFITADNGNPMGVSALIYLNLRLFQDVDLIQAIGFYSLSDSSALCKLGLGYSW